MIVGQAEADLAWYGFTPDHEKALSEQFPSFEQVKHERPGGKQDREFRARWAAERAADYRFRHNMRITNQEIRMMQEAEADRLIREYEDRQRVEKQIAAYRKRRRAA